MSTFMIIFFRLQLHIYDNSYALLSAHIQSYGFIFLYMCERWCANARVQKRKTNIEYDSFMNQASERKQPYNLLLAY